LPFRGEPEEIATQKRVCRPPSPRELGFRVPPDLERLCMDLLSPAPADRPDGAAVLRVLADDAKTERVLPAAFVGRQRELARLGRAYEELAAGHARMVLIHGESGIGKSMLMRRFTEQIVAETPSALILRGRCFERESVPYKALDEVIEALSERLLELPENDGRARVPVSFSAAARIFPVLSRVEPASTDGGGESNDAIDPMELRRVGFRALRELLRRLAAERPLVVAIDDLQWCDADS